MTSDTYFFLASAILVFICASALASDASACTFLSSTLSRNELQLKAGKNTMLSTLSLRRRNRDAADGFRTLKSLNIYLVLIQGFVSVMFRFEISSAQPCLFLQSLLGDYRITAHLLWSKSGTYACKSR